MAGQAEIPGAKVPIPAEITADGFDLGYRVATSGSVLERIMREAARVLRPGGRYAFTADEADDGRPRSVPDWRPIIEAGGLQVVSRIEIPRWRERLARMYELWLENLDEVRETFGDEYADELRDEAEAVGPSLPARTGVLYVARREYRTGTDSAPGAPSLAFEP